MTFEMVECCQRKISLVADSKVTLPPRKSGRVRILKKHFDEAPKFQTEVKSPQKSDLIETMDDFLQTFEDEKSLTLDINEGQDISKSNSKAKQLAEKRTEIDVPYVNAEEAVKLFTCDVCDHLVRSKAGLLEHKGNCHEMSINGQSGNLSCDAYCQKVVNPPGQIIQDPQPKHKRCTLSCDKCDYSATKSATLKCHQKVKHDGVRFPCTYCDYAAVSKANIKRHIEFKHKGIRHPCDQCSYVASDVYILSYHKKEKHEVVWYNCTECPFSAPTSHLLRKHKKFTHQGVRYECKDCDYVATSVSNLNRHSSSIHKGIKHPCEQCDYVATNGYQLKKHISWKHLGVRYPCELCDFTANSRDRLAAHNKSKHQGIRFNCDECQYSTGEKGNLKKHKASVHKKKESKDKENNLAKDLSDTTKEVNSPKVNNMIIES